MTGLLGHVIGRFDFETRSEQGSNRRPPISCPSASREVEGRLGAFYLARAPNDPLARHPLGKKIPLAIRLRGRRVEGGLVSESTLKNSVARDIREVRSVAIGFVTAILENFVREVRALANKKSELISVRASNKPLRDSLKNFLVEFGRLVNFFERRRHFYFVATRDALRRLDDSRRAKDFSLFEKFAVARRGKGVFKKGDNANPILVVKFRDDLVVLLVLVAEENFNETPLLARKDESDLDDLDVKGVSLVSPYATEKSIFARKVKGDFVSATEGVRTFLDAKGKGLRPLKFYLVIIIVEFSHFLVFCFRGVITSTPKSLVDFLGIGKKKIVIRQKKSRAFRLAIATVGIRLARARNFFAGFRRARFVALDLRRDDLRDLRAFFLREDFDDLRAALASFPDSFEERERAGEFLLHLRERVLFRDALRLKSVDHRGASEVIDFDRFRSFDFRSFHFAFLLFKVELFRPSKGLLVPSTLLVSIRREKVSTKENGNSFASTYDLARVELTSKLGSCHLLNYIHSPSRDFSTIGTRIIHSYNALGRVFIRREGKNSAVSKTSFKAPSARLGASSYPKSPSFRASTGFSTKLINRISSFNIQRRGAAFRLLAYSLIKTPISTSTYSSTFTSSYPSTLASTLSSSITSTLFVNSVDVPITRTIVAQK